MKTTRLLGIGLVVPAALLLHLGTPGPVLAEETIRARLRGFEEVGPGSGAVSTTGRGEFRGKISHDETAIEFRLTYQDLEGTVTAAHIHLGQRGVAGGIVIHLCGTGGKPACPASPGEVTGTLTAVDVVNLLNQGIAAGELHEVIRAIRAGVTYVNAHSTPSFATGEIRGQIRASHGHWDDD